MNVKIIKCFIASPSDTMEERNACDEVFYAINSELGDQYRFRVESVKWETDAVPEKGNDSQEIINLQLRPGEHEFFIGIFKHKFGTQTSRYYSGTEEEVTQALKYHEKQQTPEIQLYFSSEPIPQTAVLEDVQKIKDFKKKVGQEGVLYQEFSDIEDFKEKLRKNIIKKIIEMQKNDMPSDLSSANETIRVSLENKLNEALELFTDQKITWIDRRLCKLESFSSSFDDCLEQSFDASELLIQTRSCIIKATPQFGLTSLARWLILQAWDKLNEAWIYLDLDNINIQKIEKIAERERSFFGKDFSCIVLDSWATNKNCCQKVLQVIANVLPNKRIIVMQTDYSNTEYLKSASFRLSDLFAFYQLMPLPKKDLRQAVSHCSSNLKYEEDIVLNRLVSDFESLNIHRTPLNCWTLLKAAETNFDKNPINRTDMLETVLFVLFNLDTLPVYSIRPDTKDCEQILGEYCANIIKTENLLFSEEDFYHFVDQFCKNQLLNVDTKVLWKILYGNHIITKTATSDLCRFKSSFWIYFFAAKQMERDHQFYSYIFSDKRYAKYPEIIEFFTGIKRDREDVLNRLSEDLAQTTLILQEKIGLGTDIFNPLRLLQWKPSEDDVKKLKQALSDKVSSSSVPQEIKDQHADSTYNHIAPYNQDINTFLTESSFLTFLWQLKSLSRALRNSDYAPPEIRKKVLSQIIKGWGEISKVLFVLSPLLTQHGQAIFEGFSFYLSNDFSSVFSDKEKLFNQILQANPHNVIRIVKSDLSSDRLGLLFKDYLSIDRNPLIEHLTILYLIFERPNGWHKLVEDSVSKLDKNSFFLLNVYKQLQYLFTYDYMSDEDEIRFNRLMSLCLAKHDSIPFSSSSIQYYSGVLRKSIPARIDENLRDV